MIEPLEYEDNFSNESWVLEKREVGRFHSVNISGIGDLYITQTRESGLRIEASNDVLPKIITRVEDSTLHVFSKNIRHAGRINIYANMPEIRHLKASGAVRIFTRSSLKADRLTVRGSGSSRIELNVKAEAIEIRLSGSCRARLEGSVETCVIKASGSVKVKAYDLMAKKVDHTASGAVLAELYVHEDLACKLSGSSKVKTKGEAKISKIITSGSAKIMRER